MSEREGFGEEPGREEDRQGGKVGVLHRIGSFFALREDEDEELLEEGMPPQRPNVVNLSNRDPRRSGTEVTVFAPKAFSEVSEIADALRGRQVVIVNMLGLDRGLLQRVVDFTSGVAYTLEGKMQKLAEAMYLVVPPGVAVNVQGLRETLGRDSALDFMADRGHG
jgi:FtsZ-interacting cell division protein YlmF